MTSEMKRFQKEVVALLAQQRKEHDQKMEVKRLENRVEIRKQMISPENEAQSLKFLEKVKERIDREK